MRVNEVEQLIEPYSNLLVRYRQLESRLNDLNVNDPLQEESIFMRLEQINEQLYELDSLIDVAKLTDREILILDKKLEGSSLDEIGRFFNLTSERIRQILNGVYRKLSEAHNI